MEIIIPLADMIMAEQNFFTHWNSYVNKKIIATYSFSVINLSPFEVVGPFKANWSPEKALLYCTACKKENISQLLRNYSAQQVSGLRYSQAVMAETTATYELVVHNRIQMEGKDVME